MKELIKIKLDDIELRHQVRIIYACESGSRAWGFASTDSDWDVRFLYLHPLNWYLSIWDNRDVIELPIDDDLDINGWDFRKSLRLLYRCNPALSEWLSSPIVYRADETVMTEYRELAGKLFHPQKFYRHYIHMAKTNFREYLHGEFVRLKKYLYVLRPLLACRWIETHRTRPPMLFADLLSLLLGEPEVLNSVNVLVRRKMSGDELNSGPRIPELHEFIVRELERCREIAAERPRMPNDQEHLSELDVYFRRVIMTQE